MKKGTRKSITKLIAAKSKFTERDILKILELFFDECQDLILKDIPLEFRGFGTFKVVKGGRTVARHVKAGLPMELPDYKRVKYKASKELRLSLKEPLTK